MEATSTLYMANEWSKSGNQIIGKRYFLINIRKDVLMEMKMRLKPATIDGFISYLRRSGHDVEEVFPESMNF